MHSVRRSDQSWSQRYVAKTDEKDKPKAFCERDKRQKPISTKGQKAILEKASEVWAAKSSLWDKYLPDALL